MFRRILVGWDGSAGSHHALRAALDLAADLHAEVVALALIHPPAHPETAEERAAGLQGATRQATQGLDPHRHQAANTSVALSVEVATSDHPGPTLVSHAADHGFDMLVIGRHGTSSAVHPGMGPVAEHVTRHSRCPTLIVGS